MDSVEGQAIQILCHRGRYGALCLIGPQPMRDVDGCLGVWLVTEQGAGQAKQRVMLAMAAQHYLAMNLVDKMPRVIACCAPHVLLQRLVSPGSLPLFDNGKVDVGTWLSEMLEALHNRGTLVEALDGGRASYLRLCREDILRILMVKYDETPIQPRNQPFQVPDAAEMTVADIWSSPLKRRYYAEETWASEAARLYGKQMICGHGDAGPFWVNVDRMCEIREQVEECGRRALAGNGAASEIQRFFVGERSKAWQQLREIVRSAKRYVWMEDAWLGSDVVALLGEDLPDGVHVRVLGPEVENRWWKGALASLKSLAEDLPGQIEIRITAEVHDRYIYADDRVWRSSDSFKDMAAKKTTKIIDEGERSAELVADFEARWKKARLVYPP